MGRGTAARKAELPAMTWLIIILSSAIFLTLIIITMTSLKDRLVG